jgi:hypothetical protein
VNDYIKKILSKLSNPSWALKNRNDFVDVYGLSDDEYLKGIVDFEFKSLKKLEGEFFSTLTYKNSGSYDFVFKVTNLQFINYGSGIQSLDGNSLFGEVIRIYVDIDQGGTVEITDELGPATVYINDKLISDGDVGWEIDSEVRELVIEMMLTKETELFNNIRTYDIIEIYVQYPEE